MDSRTARDGRTIEEVGFYHPIEIEEKQLKLKEDRIKGLAGKRRKTYRHCKKTAE